jgi:hypothetical protein
LERERIEEFQIKTDLRFIRIGLLFESTEVPGTVGAGTVLEEVVKVEKEIWKCKLTG